MLDPAPLLARLVAIPSINPAYRTAGQPAAWFGEAAVAQAVVAWLHDAGLQTSIDPAEGGRPNLLQPKEALKLSTYCRSGRGPHRPILRSHPKRNCSLRPLIRTAAEGGSTIVVIYK